jgi:hypothetical protein
LGQSTQQSSQAKQSPSSDWRETVSVMPPEPLNDSERALRYERNAVFDDDSGSKRPMDLDSEEPDPKKGHGASIYYTRIDPSPSSKSDAVVVGTVTAFQPYFSNDKTAIYIELQLHVDKIFKDRSSSIRDMIAIDEGGGAILLPSGKIAKQERFRLETDIDVGKRYVLFLSYAERTKSFAIVKVWELKNGHAVPLAERDVKDEKTGTSKYARMPEADFLNAVESVTHTSE